MPELPEVESVCRLMTRTIAHHTIESVEVAPDEIVLGGVEPSAIEAAVIGRKITGVGRKGKYWWLEFEDAPYLFGHLGMSGWIREVGSESRRLHAHGDAPLDDQEGRPKFLKLLIETDNGKRIAFTDGRRLGRLWLADGPDADERVKALGPDAYDELPKAVQLGKMLAKRKAPIKAILLDQGFLAGLGNWLADEILYRSKISPKRLASSLSEREVKVLHNSIRFVLKTAIDADADYHKFPDTWMFHHRWGGDRGQEFIGGKKIVREQVGGRTTAWVPDVQK
jgi:formamidopyrimidine-DNA glycosylase